MCCLLREALCAPPWIQPPSAPGRCKAHLHPHGSVQRISACRAACLICSLVGCLPSLECKLAPQGRVSMLHPSPWGSLVHGGHYIFLGSVYLDEGWGLNTVPVPLLPHWSAIQAISKSYRKRFFPCSVILPSLPSQTLSPALPALSWYFFISKPRWKCHLLHEAGPDSSAVAVTLYIT